MIIKRMAAMLALLVITCAAFSQAKKTTITVDITPLKVDTLVMVDGSKVTFAKTPVNGKYIFNYTGEFPKRINLSIPKKSRIIVYLEKGDNITVKSRFDKKMPVFTGKGAANEIAFYKIYNSLSGSFRSIKEIQNKPEGLGVQFDTMFSKAFPILEAYKKTVTPGFYKDQYASISYQYLGFKLDVPFWFKRYNKKSLAETVPANYWDLEKEVKFDDKLLNNEEYQSTMFASLPGFYELKYKINSGKPDSILTPEEVFMYKYRQIEKNYTGKTRAQALKNEIIGRLQAVKDASTVKPLYDEYLKTYSAQITPADVKSVEDVYNSTIRLAAGQTPPPFTLKDVDGKDVTLKDFYGKVIYMDFWASWCSPCRAQMKMGAPKLHKKYADNKDIVFLYINMDERMELAKKAIAEDHIEGAHLFSGGFNRDNAIVKAFNIGGIPRYVIIGKDGKIFDNDAPRPTDDATPAKIDMALKAN